MKKIATLTIMILLLLGMFSFNTSAQENVSVYIDGAKIEFDVQPQIINGRTMVPMRKIFEELGAVVDWDNSTQTAIGTKGSTTIKISINDYTLYKNGIPNVLDVPAQLIDSKTFVPIRAISESFDCKVDWNANNSSVYISTFDETLSNDESRLYCFFDNVNYMQALANKQIKITPAMEVTYDQYINALKNNNTLSLNGEQFKIDPSYIEYQGTVLITDGYDWYSFDEPYKNQPASVVYDYLGLDPITVKISDGLMIRYGVLGYDESGEPYDYEPCGRNIFYTAEEYFPHFYEYSFGHDLYRATIQNGELVILDVMFHP